MKKRLYLVALAAYCSALSILVIIQVAPTLTGIPWKPETLYVIQALAAGLLILASGTLAADFYCMFRAYGLLKMPWSRHKVLVQKHILRFADDLYCQQGYFKQGAFSALNIALQYSVDEKNSLVDDAMVALVQAGKLQPHQSDKGTVYTLSSARQMELITQHDLSHKWEERGGRYHPNDVLVGEIQRVQSAVAAKQRQEVYS